MINNYSVILKYVLTIYMYFFPGSFLSCFQKPNVLRKHVNWTEKAGQ